VARPARRLADAARRIAAGDRTARVGIQGQDELAMLGRTFDEMAEALDTSWQALSAGRDAAEGMAARLATLSQLASLVSSSLDPSRVFAFIAEAASRLLDGAVVLLLVSDAEDGPLSLRATFGVTRPELRARNSFRAGEGLPGAILQTREPLVLTNILDDPRALNRAWAKAEGLRAFAGVPMVLRDRCLGVLYAASRGEQPFAARDVDLLTSFAAHAAVAIQNAHLYERAAREAQEKGLLLDELNHRVRNNLAMMVSFMELQRATLAGRAVASVLDEAIGRVKGLALIHDVLGGASFQAGQYDALVQRLAGQTLLQGPLAGCVELRVDKEPLRLPSKTLTALGIITNELFTNIAKHAFPDGRKGAVEVSVALVGPEVVIRVHDNGVKLAPGFAEGPGQLGLRLVRSLVEVSLQGSFSLEANEGTTAIIRFPRPEDGEPGPSPFPGEAQRESATCAARGS
jgi:two-component sensor histidine kinase